MRRIAVTVMLALLALAAYLSLWPVPIQAESWSAPAAPGYTGVHAANDRLAGLHNISLGAETGPEHVLLAGDGTLYTAVASGKILRMQPDGSGQQVYASTGGRPLGLDFDAQGNLVAADALKGLLSIDQNGKITVLTDTVDNDAIRFANAVAVAGNGKIYFSDASTRFAPAQWGGTVQAATLDVMEQSCSGRILVYDTATRTTRVVALGLSLPNGLVLSSDQQTLLVAESGRYRVWKIAVTAAGLDVRRDVRPDLGRNAAQAQVLFDNLPGYPDNLTRGRSGRIWLGLAGQRNGLDAMATRPFLRQMALRVPQAWWVRPQPYGHVMAFTEDGAVVADLQDPSGQSPITTGATESADRLYIHNVSSNSLGWLAR